MLIRLLDGRFVSAADPYLHLGDEDPAPAGVRILVSFERLLREGPGFLEGVAGAGVLVQPDERVEALAGDLGRLCLVALAFPKFRDGRPYSSAMLLRRRYGYRGEVRAVGDVLRDQAFEMVRCGFDGFVPADGATPKIWAEAAGRFTHVYQPAGDGRRPAFLQRSAVGAL